DYHYNSYAGINSSIF
nr:immunoglobulin light chain junction region [Macaca mulatta]